MISNTTKSIVRAAAVFIVGLAILKEPLFFSLAGLVGIEYKGSESTNIYKLYLTVVFLLSLGLYFFSLSRGRLFKKEWIALWVVAIIFMFHAVWVIFDLETEPLPDFLILFVVLGLPGLLTGFSVVRLNLLDSVIRFLEIAFSVVALGVIVYSVVPSISGVRVTNIAGASYQTLSYYSAFTFGMLFLYNFILPKGLRYGFVRSVAFKCLSLALILGCAIGVFLGGGRGAFVLLLLYAAYFSFSIFIVCYKGATHAQIQGFIAKVFVIIIIIVSFFSLFWSEDFVQTGYSRATQFISPHGGIDLTRGSSGRDVVYADTLSYIEDRPLLGYGPLGFREKSIHAHNIFLELVLQFGVVGLLVFLWFAVAFFIRVLTRWSVYSLWGLAMLLYPMTMVMFSSSFMHSSIFLFAIAFLSVNRAKGLKRAVSVE